MVINRCKFHPIFLLALLSATLSGCSLPPAARREIALLKNEILDLQTQYYALKDEYVRATGTEPFLDYSLPSGTPLPGGPGGVIDREGDEIYWDSRKNSPAGDIPGNAWSSDEDQRPSLVETFPDERDECGASDNGFRPPRLASLNQRTTSVMESNGDGQDATYASYRSDSPTTDENHGTQNLAAHVLSVSAASYWDDSNPSTGVNRSLRVQLTWSTAGASDDSPRTQISLLDIQRPSGQQRLGFWELNPDQVRRLLKRSDRPGEIDLLLPWPDDVGEEAALRLFVRQRVGGQWIEAHTDVAH